MTERERTAAAGDRDDMPSPELRHMIDEVRASAPQLDWERLESRLFDADGNVHEQSGVLRVSRPEPVAVPSRPSRARWSAVAAGLALAAAFALAVLTPTRTFRDSSPSVTAPVAAQRAPLLDESGRPVVVGQRVVASSGTWLRSEGRIAIHLEPGTLATVLDVGERVHLALDNGAVAADVVPVPGGEPFAVDVAGQRVAVHGTRLRVALLGQAVQVAVSEGSAVVGLPRGQGRTEGTIVPAGTVDSFGAPNAPATVAADAALASKLVEESLLGSPKASTSVAVADAPKAAHEALVHPATKPAPAAEPSVTAPAVTPTVPVPAPGLSAEQLREPLSKLTPSLQTCVRKTAAGVVFVNEQDLTIEISAAGKASLVTADPGLDTADRACWSLVVSALTFPAAPGATTVKRHVVVGSP